MTIKKLLFFIQVMIYFEMMTTVEMNTTVVPQKTWSELGCEISSSNCSLKNKRLTLVESFSFGGYNQMTSLDLSSNALVEIEIGSFYGITLLKKLNLAHNQITKVDFRFGAWHQLAMTWVSHDRSEVSRLSYSRLIEDLDLGHNKIEQLQPDSFEGLIVLKRLVLDNNQIKNLGENAFSGLVNIPTILVQKGIDPESISPQLQYLYLANNTMTSLSPNAFEGLDNLELVSLYNNKFTNLNMSAFNGIETCMESSNSLPKECLRNVEDKKIILLTPTSSSLIKTSSSTTQRSPGINVVGGVPDNQKVQVAQHQAPGIKNNNAACASITNSIDYLLRFLSVIAIAFFSQ